MLSYENLLNITDFLDKIYKVRDIGKTNDLEKQISCFMRDKTPFEISGLDM